MSKRLLIFSAAFGHTNPLPLTFLQSARQAGIEADIVLFRHCRDGKEEEELKNLYPETHVIAPLHYEVLRIIRKALVTTGMVRPVTWIMRTVWKRSRILRGKIEAIAPYLLGVMAIRFFMARSYLMERKNEYSAVLLIDSRDVIFQGNPLDDFEGGLMVGEENCVIGNQNFNRDWLKAIYGATSQTLNTLWPKKVICAGVTLGSTSQVLSYLDQMCAEFLKQLPQLAYQEGFDQAVHNKILYLDRHNLDLRLTNNFGGVVANLATSDLSEFKDDWANGIRTRDGQMVSIVHQYDRHPKLTDVLLARLGLDAVTIESRAFGDRR